MPLFLVLLLACCGYAMARGGAPERVGGALLLGAYVVDEALHRAVDGLGYRSVATGSLLLDLALLVGLTVVAVRSTRFWPLWLAGWQAAAVMGHLSKVIDRGMMPAGYAVQAQIWAYPMVMALGVATWRHRRRRALGDPDPAWKTEL